MTPYLFSLLRGSDDLWIVLFPRRAWEQELRLEPRPMSELIDNRAHRIRTLKTIIQSLHAGTATQDVRTQLKQLVHRTDASEIAAVATSLARYRALCSLPIVARDDLFCWRG